MNERPCLFKDEGLGLVIGVYLIRLKQVFLNNIFKQVFCSKVCFKQVHIDLMVLLSISQGHVRWKFDSKHNQFKFMLFR